MQSQSIPSVKWSNPRPRAILVATLGLLSPTITLLNLACRVPEHCFLFMTRQPSQVDPEADSINSNEINKRAMAL